MEAASLIHSALEFQLNSAVLIAVPIPKVCFTAKRRFTTNDKLCIYDTTEQFHTALMSDFFILITFYIPTILVYGVPCHCYHS